MRHPTALLVLIGVLVLSLALPGAAPARDITLPKTAPEALRAACDAAGGKFSQETRGYGCGTDCAGGPGTDCTVFCPAGEKCTAQVIGGRRPHSVAAALSKPTRHAR